MSNLQGFFTKILDNERITYLLNKTIYFTNSGEISPELYHTYEIKNSDTWFSISYQTYGTIDGWWIICRFNNIRNPFDFPSSGEYIKLPTVSVFNIVQNQL